MRCDGDGMSLIQLERESQKRFSKSLKSFLIIAFPIDFNYEVEPPRASRLSCLLVWQ